MMKTRRKHHPIRDTLGDKLFYAGCYLITALFMLAVLYPLVYILSASFSSAEAITSGRMWLYPVDFSLVGYKYILKYDAIWLGYRNTLFLATVGTLLTMTMMVVTAYPLTKRNLKGRNFILTLWVITMFFGGGMIPNYLLICNMGLRDTIWSLVLPGALPVFNLVLMLNFFRQVPPALEDAALIDGAGHLRTLVQIYLPVSLPAIATITLFCIVSHWNAWFDGMIYITTPSRIPMQTYLRSILIDMNIAEMSADDYELYASLANRTVKCSQIIVATIPILCVYPFLQRYFVSGIVLGSVKG